MPALNILRMDELGERLEQIFFAGSSRREEAPSSPSERRQSLDTPAAAQVEEASPGLLASLELSLDKLDEVARQVLLRLGDFQGGALEDDLIARSQCWAKT